MKTDPMRDIVERLAIGFLTVNCDDVGAHFKLDAEGEIVSEVCDIRPNLTVRLEAAGLLDDYARYLLSFVVEAPRVLVIVETADGGINITNWISAFDLARGTSEAN